MNAAELTTQMGILIERLERVTVSLEELKADHKKLQQEHNDHRREAERENALLKREVEELKRSKDLWGNRAFTLLMCLVSAAVGGFITHFVKKP